MKASPCGTAVGVHNNRCYTHTDAVACGTVVGACA